LKLLLDTHVWLWALTDPARLVPRVRKALGDAQNELWLSPISVGEAFLLCRKGRLEPVDGGDAWEKVSTSLANGKHMEASLTFGVALEFSRVHLAHRDPADRYLVATARYYDLTLVTADALLLETPNLKLLSAR